jgi:hypothetical protein
VTDPTFTIDDKSVPLSSWQLEAEADWGDRTLTGQVPRSVTLAEQGAPVKAWRSDGTLLWSGEMPLDPRPDGDVLFIRAEGFAENLAAQRTRMFYRKDGTDGWVNAEDEPHNYNVDEDVLDCEVRPTSLFLRWRKGETVNTGQSRGWLIWVEGSTITRYTFTHIDNMGVTDNVWRIYRATGPAGGATQVADHSLLVGSANVAQNVSSAEDELLIFYRRNGGNHTAAQTFKGRIVKLQIYGRTTSDTFSASDVVSDVGTNAGFDVSGVQSNSLAVLPLDWTDPHPALLTFMAELTDWRWLLRGEELRFGPFERTWSLDTTTDAVATLEPEKRYRRVRIPFRNLAGVMREGEAIAADTSAPDETWYGPALEDPQQNDTLAVSAAGLLADHMASRRVSGSVQIGKVRGVGPASPYDVEAGDLLNMTDLAPDLGPQRIRTATYRPGEDVTVGIGEPFDPMRIMADARGRKRVGRRKHRRWVETSI